MTLHRSNLFARQYQRLPVALQRKVDRVLMFLAQDLRHPGAHAKKIVGHPDRWEARVDYHCRLTFEIQGDTLVFRKVGSHDILKTP